MQTVSTETRARIIAGYALEKASATRARIGGEITPQSRGMLLDWYDSALADEEKARAVYSAALDAENLARARAAFLN